MIRRPAGRLGIDTAKAKLSQIKLLDKNVDHTNRIVLADPVFHAFRKQRALPAIRSLNKALHQIPRKSSEEPYRGNQIRRCVFTQAGSLADTTANSDRVRFYPNKGHEGGGQMCLLWAK